MMQKVELKIKGLSYSENQSGAYALLLSEETGKGRELPVIIGKSEAYAIIRFLERKSPERLLTHDLMKVITEALQGDVVEVNIIKLVEGVFFAEICLVKDTHIFRIDARVSDAIALSIRFGAPIYAREEIMQKAAFKPEILQTDSLADSDTPLEGSSFSDYTEKQIKMMLQEAIREENYERAALLKKEMERRG